MVCLQPPRGVASLLSPACPDPLQVRPLSEVSGVCNAKRLQRPWDWAMRKQHFQEDEAMRWVQRYSPWPAGASLPLSCGAPAVPLCRCA